MAGAPKGNVNASKGKPWREAMDRALKRTHELVLNGEKITLAGRDLLDKAVMKLLVAAAEGDLDAIKELANRLDGRPAQAVELEVTDSSAAKMMEAEARLEKFKAGSFSAQVQEKLPPLTDDLPEYLQ